MVDSIYLESCIIKTMMCNEQYTFTIISSFNEEYFDHPGSKSIFSVIKKNIIEFHETPQKSIIINSVSNKEDVESFFRKIENNDFDTTKDYDWLLTKTNDYLKEKAIKTAILKSVDIIENKDNVQKIRDIIEDALCKDLKIDLGTEYFDDFISRMKRIIESDTKKVPSFYPELDEYLNGGFIPYSLSIIGATIHKGKSLLVANMASRQVVKGYNVVLMSMEMSEDAFSQRFDSIYSKNDINKIYIKKSIRNHMIEEVFKIKNDKNTGKLYIKEFPTGNVNVNDFRKYLRELRMRKIEIDILYCDYIGIMKAISPTGDLYKDGKHVAEELRSLSLEFNIPVIAPVQLNKDGNKIDLKEIDFSFTAESQGIPATSDFYMVLGDDEDLFTYDSEIHYKITKNRLGGMVGDIKKFFIDKRSLKIYGEDEYDEWIDDVKFSNDSRDIKKI